MDTQMIVLDLEWNRGYDNKPLEEILQIGAVRLDRLGGRILDTFDIRIKPCVHKRFNRAAKALPEAESYQRATVRFPEALRRFLDWCGEETEFAGWGSDDFLTLRQNCAYWKVPVPKLPRVYDLQAAFSLLLGTRQQIALHWAVDYCRIPDSFTFHNALYDAVYTALVGAYIPAWHMELLKLPAKMLQFAQYTYPTQPVVTIGPYPSREALLSSPASRRPACPVCGQRTMVQNWSFATQEQYFAPFRCAGHGRFLCRLTPRQDPEGAWWGEVTVPDISPEMLESYAAATAGSTFHCKARRSKRRRGKARRRPYRGRR